MKTIVEALSSLRTGESASFANLTLVPLFGSGDRTPEYLTLDEALDSGIARVTEVSEHGSVPELKFENAGERRVLLVDGEELVGAKQNRVLNVTIMVGAKQNIVIPVSCVERGRWSYRSREFKSAGRNLFAKARAAKFRDVTQDLRLTGRRRGNQAKVWMDIDHTRAALNVDSHTEAIGDVYEQRQRDLAGYESAFTALDQQLGAVFAINGKVRGLELFDSSATFAKFMKKLVGSYAVDAIEESIAEAKPMALDDVKEFLSRLQKARVERFKAIAEGDDIRINGEHTVGGALVVERRIVHLAAFSE